MKSLTVTFSPVAIDDIEQTFDYYEKQQPGLVNDLRPSYNSRLMLSIVTLFCLRSL